MIAIRRAKFHNSVQAFGEVFTFYPLNKTIDRFQVTLDTKLSVLCITDGKTTVEVPLTNVVFYERKAINKPASKKKKTDA
ncbi:MAG: hypothetical protein GTO02_02920 [Candidatus Dadabacteria bacterium]|nr:hypothetical protein [Candidatus Dadabacteria bacterium]